MLAVLSALGALFDTLTRIFARLDSDRFKHEELGPGQRAHQGRLRLFAKPSERRINVQKLALGEPPVNIALSTSTGGSPRLAVTPAFRTLVMEGRDRLVIVRYNRLEWLDPTGKLGSVRLSGKGTPLALAARANGVKVYVVNRHYHWGKQP